MDTYKPGDYIDTGSHVFKILSVEDGKYGPRYKIERICNRYGFAPHKAERFPKYTRAFLTKYCKVLDNPPIVKRNWLWDKKEAT